VRAIERGLVLVDVQPSSHPLENLEKVVEMGKKLDFAAMVPMQVYSSMQVPSERQALAGIRHIIIGGGPLDPSLEAELRQFPNAIWHSYGMTETLSHVALRRVSGSGATPWFTPMPGVILTVNDDHCLVIDAPHLCPERLVTRDVVEMEPGTQRFKVLGRLDNVINTGGVKIHIEQVEQALAPHITQPFLITKCPDPKFGEIVVMLLQGTEDDVLAVRDACHLVLTRYECPKLIFAVPALPMTPTGKPARSEAASQALSLLKN